MYSTKKKYYAGFSVHNTFAESMGQQYGSVIIINRDQMFIPVIYLMCVLLATYDCMKHSGTTQYSSALNTLSVGTTMCTFYIQDISITCGLMSQEISLLTRETVYDLYGHTLIKYLTTKKLL